MTTDRTEHIVQKDGMSFVTFDILEKAGFVRHGIAARTGGVSTGCFESLNLSYSSGDQRENVEENFRRAGSFFGVSPDHMIAPWQTHTAEVMRVGEESLGRGVTRERLVPDCDGLITDVPGIMLNTSHADCTPILLADPVRKAVAAVHSGWRGTAGRIGQRAVEAMRKEFGTDPADILAAIGPCNCGRCYEVGPEVAEVFMEMFGAQTALAAPDVSAFSADAAKRPADPAGLSGEPTYSSGAYFRSAAGAMGPMLKARENGKYFLDQKAINFRILTDAGIRPEHIAVSALCTYERSDLFYSHRKMGPKRGGFRSFIGILEEE